VDDCTADMARDHAEQIHAKRNNECSRRFKHCHAVKRKVKRITSIIGQASEIAVEQQSNSTLAVAAIHATTSGTNLMNL
jgi:hypothetical protein